MDFPYHDFDPSTLPCSRETLDTYEKALSAFLKAQSKLYRELRHYDLAGLFSTKDYPYQLEPYEIDSGIRIVYHGEEPDYDTISSLFLASENYRREQREAYLKWRAVNEANEERLRRGAEEREREEYERLKAKFEGGNK